MSQLSQNPYYQNGGAGGGGGYITGGSPHGSTSGSPGGGYARRGAAAHSLRPCTIKQLLNATQAHTDAEWHIEDVEIGQVTVVAQVVSIQVQATSSVYWLDDGTGRMEARHWIDSSTLSEENPEDPNAIKEGSYLRVLGTIKTFSSKRYINAAHLRASTDPHEVYFHELDVIATKLMIERGMPNKQPQNGVQQTPQTGTANGASAYNAQPHNASTLDQYAHLPPVERQICKFLLEQPPSDEGIHVGNIARAIGGNAQAIGKALDNLLDEGHVYTTLDESHYALSI